MHHPMICRGLAFALVVASLAGCASTSRGAAPGGDDAATFILTLGNDTVAAESYRRTGDRVEGMIVRRVPRTVVVRYVMDLAPNGLVSRLVYNTRLPDGNIVPNGSRSVTVTFTADSAITELDRDPPVTRRVAASNAYPELESGVFFFTRPLAALRASQRDSATFYLYAPGATQASARPVARRSDTRWWIYSFDNPTEITTDAADRLISLDGSRTTFRVQARRQPYVDLSALVTAFAERERAAGPMAALSPRDSVRATIGDAQVSVVHGRPSARGRQVWSENGVLGDTLWRTGANAATQFNSTAHLDFGNGRRLPPGTYVLTTLAVPGRYELIFTTGNQQVLRVPLTARSLPSHVEQFTINVDPSGMLRLQWAGQELVASFAVIRP